MRKAFTSFLIVLSITFSLSILNFASSVSAVEGTFKGEYFKFKATSRRVFNFVRINGRHRPKIFRTVIFKLYANRGYFFKDAKIKFKGKNYEFKANKDNNGRYKIGVVRIHKNSFGRTKVYIDFTIYNVKTKNTLGLLVGLNLDPAGPPPRPFQTTKLKITKILM